MDGRIPVLYLAPWVDIGGADKGTIDWFRFLDRDRFRPSLITTQPSLNRRLAEVAPYADEVWELTQLMPGEEFPRFILAFIQSRGVRLVHVMNSRLGFELLPDIAALANPPRVVVQLHVEETDCSGYVRYVTTRYGNLVDAFSVSTQALSRRLDAYDVPIAKRRLIRTGVDAEREFSPGRVRPIKGLDADRFQITFAARLTAQKDPLLMLDVAARMREDGLAFQIHVLGDGDLNTLVREQIAAGGLEREVIMHGNSLEVARWYAASDAALLTSRFEGLPYVAYEAMAMGLPLVAPQLSGLDELVTPETSVLVTPRDDVLAYADALAALAREPARRQRMGELARSRVRSQYSLERMAAEHGALYEDLLARTPQPARHPARPANANPPGPPTAASFRDRRPGATPLVTVIVPCFNHGRYLPGCLRSVLQQTYRRIETIVVDDGSDDLETLSVLTRLEADGSVVVVRLPENRGPGAARNAGIERASGRYLLPLDADNLLVPTAVADLVEQLGNAGERVGFVYPNLQYFGNRLDYLEAPSYNLHALLGENYCDTASLFDREVFDRGLRYAEDIVLGHEDWDFALSLAENGIYGQPARTTTLLYRKFGFTRSDLVTTCLHFDAVVADRHPRLFGIRTEIKGEWNPSLTVIGLDPVCVPAAEAMPKLVAAATNQTCSDFELIVRTSFEPWPTELGARLRRIPAQLGGSRAKALAEALAVARGRYVLAAYGSPAALLADHALAEKVVRVLQSNGDKLALALGESAAGCSPFRLLGDEDAAAARLGALCWAASGPAAPPPSLPLPAKQPLEALARSIVAHGRLQWRHMSRPDRPWRLADNDSEGAVLGEPRRSRAKDVVFTEADAALPECPPGYTANLNSQTPWRPPQTRVLYRHCHPPSGRYVYTNNECPPPGCVLDSILGALRALPLPGTTSLVGAWDERPLGVGEPVAHDDPALLGFVEQVRLPLLDELQLGRDCRTGQAVLVAGLADPAAERLDDVRTIGYVEPHPIHPRGVPQLDVGLGLVGLVRTVDLRARRHRYGAGQVPSGVPGGELGALLASPTPDTDPLWIDDEGRVFTAQRALANGRPSLRAAVRWTGAPLTWSKFSWVGPKLRASVRRAYDSTRMLIWGLQDGVPRPSDPAGYLLRSATSRSLPLYAAIHPVTGDQLLSNTTTEPSRLGYRHIALLGYLVAQAPVTGKLGAVRVKTPWASRFGLAAVTR